MYRYIPSFHPLTSTPSTECPINSTLPVGVHFSIAVKPHHTIDVLIWQHHYHGHFYGNMTTFLSTNGGFFQFRNFVY